jgi:single-stranded-DNA-specific exonuclease
MSEAAALTAPLPERPARPLQVVPGAAEPNADAAPAPIAGSAPAPTAPGAPRPTLELPGYDFAAALELERELGISHIVSQLLVRRGLVDPGLARAFLEAREAHEWSAFAGIERAVSLIERHVQAGSRIVVHGDYDVDGVCATAIMIRALRSLGADVAWFLPDRIDDGYGLALATVERLAARGADLLITVDCGITAVAEVEAALAAGIDVVVSDHHAPRADGRLPDCPIVHPAVCGYPCPDLCGTAVAFKLAQALGAATAGEEIELVGLATVADLMPLKGENRRLVREGLTALAGTARPGLRALMTVARVDPSAIDAHVLGFRVAPRINAAGRIRRADAGLELLLTGDPQRAREIAVELDGVNAERRAIEQRIAWEAEAQVAGLGERPAYVLWAEDWHPGVIGIVASRVVEQHHRPTILIALDEEGTGHGSGRSIPGFDLLGALQAASDQLERYGGHRAAAGLTVAGDRLEVLRAAIEDHAAEVLTPELLRPVERVDAVASGGELGLALAEELELLEPCGVGNPGPRLLVPGARFGDLRAMGEGRHARFSVSSGGARARAVAFGCDGRLDVEPGEPADATFRLERNVWNGAVEPRLVLRHARPCAPAPIEVLGEGADYLTQVLEQVDGPLPLATASGPPPPAPMSGPLSPVTAPERLPPAPTPGPLPPASAPGPREQRRVFDRRGASPLAVLADVIATGEPVLAVSADVARRLEGLRARVGGFALVCHHALELDHSLSDPYRHVVVLDPPSSAGGEALLCAGSGFTHLCWTEAELRFAQQMHELEYGLRASLAALYRGLRHRQRVAGQELEHLLRGDGAHGRPARLAGRLVRVLAELELVSLDRGLPALAVAGEERTALERSPAYRAYAARYEDGRRYLTSGNLPPSA